MNFQEKLEQAVKRSRSTLCVGLDPNLDLLPDPIKNMSSSSTKKVELFLKKVINVTTDHCVAYKPNLGFFEALGPDGWDTFAEILDYIPSDKIIIADAKRGDISSTGEHYAKAFFNQFEVDALTLNPLMGFETLDPFLNSPEKAIFVLTLTSNPGAEDLLLQELDGGQTVSNYISGRLRDKQEESDTAIGMVVGATKSDHLQRAITPFPEAPLLIPGVGKQGGSIKSLAKSLESHASIPMINSSRSIIYAGNGISKWEQAVGQAAENLQQRLSLITERYV